MALRRAFALAPVSAVIALLLMLVPALLAPHAAVAAEGDQRTRKERIPEYGVEPGDKNALGNQRTWAVQPSGPNGPGIRPSFSYALAPGTTIVDWVGVSNLSRKSLTLQLYATDAFNTKQGTFDLLAAGPRPVDVGSWVRFRQNEIKVPARSRMDIPFELVIPRNASPGDHVGGVVAALRSDGVTKGGALVAVDQRIAARMYLRVDGPVKPSIAVTKLSATYHHSRNPVGGSATVAWTVRNTGNVRLAGGQRLTLSLPGGSSRSVRLPPLAELLPGNSVTFRTKVSKVRPAFRVTAKVSVVARLVDPDLGDVRAPAARASRSVTFWAIPLAILALLGLLLLALAAYLIRRRRRLARLAEQATTVLPEHRGKHAITLPEKTRAGSAV